jgi:eukaryotic-like serine/threonine-protein kinase
MICPRCHAPAPDAEPDCPSCGAQMAESATVAIGRDAPTGFPLPDLDGLTRLPSVPLAGDAMTRLPDAVTGVRPSRNDDDGADAPTSLRGTVSDEDASVTGGVASQPGKDGGPLAAGQAFGPRYHIISLIGLGGMGAVYQAWDAELDVVVALKVIRPEVAADPEAARSLERRFKRELLLARQVTHSNVVRIHDLGEIGGVKYISMPFVEGSDLASVLQREEKLSVARTLRIARTALSGLVAAHDAGVVHRDLKPANLMITEGDNALIMDFGIARSTGEADPRIAATERPGATSPRSYGDTTVGQIVGTIEYMAPEQARGEEADQRADIYAFGLILYDMLLGRRRHRHATTAVAELRERMAQTPPSPRSVDEAIPEAVDAIVMRCLKPDPAARFQTSADLVAAFDRLDAVGKPLPSDKRLVHLIVAGGLAIIVLMFALSWIFVRPRPPAPAKDPVPVIIADFDNSVGDPVFDGTLERALGVAVEEASFITSYSRTDAAKLATKLTPGSTLTPSMARLVAMREGVRVVLAGRIERDGGGYAVTLRALNPADGTQTWGARAVSPSKQGVLSAVNRLAVDLRKSLGDSPRAATAESLTSASLEAVQEYSNGQDLANAGKHEEAIAHYRSAVERDPRFGRAYSGWATAAYYLGRADEASTQWKKALALLDGMTEREKYRTLGAYYLGFAKNYEKAIENYQSLVRLYPTDLAGHNNLAFAYFNVLDFGKAKAEGDKARRLYPRNILIGNNYALYAMYAGDFTGSAEQARKLIEQDPSFFKNYLPLAVAALANGDVPGALDAYQRMSATTSAGASLAAIGLPDALLYAGRFKDAEAELKRGIAADEKADKREPAAVKLVALGEVYQATGRPELAAGAAKRAAEMGKEEAALVPAGRLLAQLGRSSEAMAIASRLSGKLEPQSRAHGRIVEASVAMQAGRWADAIDALRGAVKFADLWLARYDMGVAYVRAGHEVEALAELDACSKRRGEATALFLDDTPTFRALAALPYWLGRAQEGAGQRAAALASYHAYLETHEGAPSDPLVVDARKRIQ